MKKLIFLFFFILLIPLISYSQVPYLSIPETIFLKYRFINNNDVEFQWDYDLPLHSNVKGFYFYTRDENGIKATEKLKLPENSCKYIYKNYPNGMYLNWVTTYDHNDIENIFPIAVSILIKE